MGSASPTEALAILRSDRGARLVDVRPSEAFEAGHPDGAVSMPFVGALANELADRATEAFEPGQTLLVIGHSGMRSGAACRVLEAAGFQAVNVVGGVDGLPSGRFGMGAPGWRELGLPWVGAERKE
ncbi:MAG: rhodanese-like domain-containing protein [Deltaproteobacteria bacterium]|nr:MAG: rhodanese-like domain-containing protein [Deltaproteobacteria bacterium]